MYSRFADTESLCSLSYSSIIINNISSEGDSSFFDIIFHSPEKGSPFEIICTLYEMDTKIMNAFFYLRRRGAVVSQKNG